MIQRIASRFHARCATTNTSTTTKYHHDNNNSNNNNNNNNNNNSDDDSNHANINLICNYKRLPYSNVRNSRFGKDSSHSLLILPRILSTTTADRIEDDQKERRTHLKSNNDDHDHHHDHHHDADLDDNNDDADHDDGDDDEYNHDGSHDKVIGRGTAKDLDVMICGKESSFAYLLFT